MKLIPVRFAVKTLARRLTAMDKDSFPALQDFQSAHRKLLCEYIAAVDAAASLPFFVSLTKLLISQQNESSWARLNRKIWFLFAPATWKPFVRFLVELHIKAKMGELSVAYSQLALRLPVGKKYEPFRDALRSAIADCEQLSNTLTTWKSGKTLAASAVPVVAGWLTSWLGTEDLLTALPRLGIELTGNLVSGSFLAFLQVAVWGISSASLLLLLFNQAFEGKRAVFLPGWVQDRAPVDTHNVYASEDALFQLMGLHKTPEFPLDAAALAVFLLFVTVVFVLRFRYYSFSVIPINLLAMPLLVGLVIASIRNTRRRWN